MSFIDEFRNDPAILRTALAAAVGPIPEAEILPTGWIRLNGKLSTPDSALALETARAALAIYLASRQAELDEAYAEATGRPSPGRIPLEDVQATVTPEGLQVTGRIPAPYSDLLAAPVNVSVRGHHRCGDVDPDEGACVLATGHEGEHFYSMGKVGS